jgi:hypothetical protein
MSSKEAFNYAIKSSRLYKEIGVLHANLSPKPNMLFAPGETAFAKSDESLKSAEHIIDAEYCASQILKEPFETNLRTSLNNMCDNTINPNGPIATINQHLRRIVDFLIPKIDVPMLAQHMDKSMKLSGFKF